MGVAEKKPKRLPPRPIDKVSHRIAEFLHLQAAGGAVLATCTVVALVAANSGWSASYASVWEQKFTVGVGTAALSYPLWYWINDALMAIFFFVVGLEIKRELVQGELSDPRKVALPIAAAVGGAVVPVLVYIVLLGGAPYRHGWAVPMATDIAFVVGCLALWGNRVPVGLKVLMLALAIVDDLMGVTVIALFYSKGLSLGWLGAAAGGLLITWVLNRLGVRAIPVYVVVGSAAWLAMLKSGVHPTISGVALGLLTPAAPWIDEASLREAIREAADERTEAGERRADLDELEVLIRESNSPLHRLETALHPWTAFIIIPVFALANAAVPFSAELSTHPVAVGVALGLLVGKPAGIVAACALLVRTGRGTLPEGVTWGALTGASCLGGIGFTMALFIANLGLAGTELGAAKAGILIGSGASAVLGMALLAWTLPSRQASSSPSD